MIFNQGYSYRTKQLARERIEKLKQQNQQEIIIRKQKIKELSKQTNELRKKIKDKTQTLQEDEEERRATILENRKLKQRIATEKFQRIQDKRAKSRKTASKNDLKNGLYHVNGHVIEIKDGIRVNSMKQDEASKKMEETPPQYNTSYAPNTYLSNHLNELITTDLSQVKRQDIELNDKLNKISEDELNLVNNNNPLISDVLNDLRFDAQLVQRKISDAEEIESDGEQCSTDSLEDTGQEQKMLKSSLRMARDALNDSTNRKVTFSDSIEFNDGNVGKLELKPLERVPLYQRIENKINEVPKPLNNTQQAPYTAEEVLDQLREEALMTKFPEVSYPESVTAALEQLSQSKKYEKEINRDKDQVAEVPQHADETVNDMLMNYNEKLDDSEKERSDRSVVTSVAPMDASDVNEIIQYVVGENVPNHSDSKSVASKNNGITNYENYSTGYEVTMESKKVSYPIPVCSISSIHTSTLPISKHNTNMHRHDYLYQTNNIPVPSESENQPEKLSSCLSISHYTPSIRQTNETSADVSRSSQKKNDTNDTGSSAVLYVPQYPYFPSKEQRYTTNGAYDGRLPMNYYESQYNDNYRNSTHVYNHNSNTTSTSVLTTNGYHTTFTSQPSKTSSNRNYCERDNGTTGEVTRELSLSYINITACDISRSDTHSTSDDIYKEVERTLADITFSKTQNEKPSYSNNNKPINNDDTKVLSVTKLESSEASNEQNRGVLSNESKISNAIKNGTAIPVRVHTTTDGCPVRRGRVIVSADKKRRQVGNMMPRPPDKPKVNNNLEKNHKIIVATKKDTFKEENSLSGTNYKISDKNEHVKKQNKYTINNNNGYSSDDKTVNHKVSSYGTPFKTNHDYYSDQYGDRNGIINNNDNRTDFNNNNPKYSLPHSGNLPKSYVRVSPNVLPWNKSTSKNFSQIPLDKTPTDDEINSLWTNVRECIYNEQTEHAYSDSNYVIDNRYRKQYRRTLSGSSLNRKLDDRPAPRIYTNYTPGGMNRRYGSHDSLNRQIVSDNFSPVFNKPALLPQRATKVIRNSNSSNENKYTVFKGNDNLSNGHRYQYDTQTGKYGDVTASMASFLVLEELCKKQSLSPRQADAVFQASNTIQKKIDKEKAGISALSMEERCVMESLERLNEKLKEKGYKVGGGGDPRIISKPPIPEQRRRLYPTR